MEYILNKIRHLIPTKIHNAYGPKYHLILSFLSALWYRFPSRKIKVIGITGTKGKSSTVEILNAILEEAGYKTALSSTIRFKIATESSDNMYKMTMPGRFFIQRFLRKSVNSNCDYAIIEMTSQGALLNRHKFIDLDALIFTNISPEHIEAHGSYENYRASKLEIVKRLSNSKKTNKVMVANGDDAESSKFLECKAEQKITFSVKDAEPYTIKNEGIDFTLANRSVHSSLSGLFNLYNILAAATMARSQNVNDDIIVRAISKFTGIAGRVQKILSDKVKNQDFAVIVDYAHTPDSLEKLYQVFQNSRNICVLGGTGGGRDIWKRREMGRIADQYCDEIILTNEDPYDESPDKIVNDVSSGITSQAPTIIMDRRIAIREAIKRAKTGDSVLITGKGTDPYIMGPNGTKTPWSDANIAREELESVLSSTN